MQTTDRAGQPIVAVKLTSYKSKNWVIHNIPDGENSINCTILMLASDFESLLQQMALTDMHVLLDGEDVNA